MLFKFSLEYRVQGLRPDSYKYSSYKYITKCGMYFTLNVNVLIFSTSMKLINNHKPLKKILQL